MKFEIFISCFTLSKRKYSVNLQSRRMIISSRFPCFNAVYLNLVMECGTCQEPMETSSTCLVQALLRRRALTLLGVLGLWTMPRASENRLVTFAVQERCLRQITHALYFSMHKTNNYKITYICISKPT